jgi:SAM-dependent methyltransferase
MSYSSEKEDYFSKRLPYDPYRDTVWWEIVRFLRVYIPRDGVVLEVGAAYCHFINHVTCRERHALDVSPIVKDYAAKGVIVHTGSVTRMNQFDDNSLDLVFASNVFEHLDDREFEDAAREIRRVLKPSGRLILLQPNFRYAYRDYFDDYTHKKIFNDVGMSGHLEHVGFAVERVLPRFCPFSLSKSPFKVPGFLVRLYLNSPIRPFSKQMLVIARANKQHDGCGDAF